MSTASPSLNPYRDLFGIDTSRPDYYELLGLPAFTGGQEEIRRAASARLRQIDPPPGGMSAEQCQQIANEVAAARDCLCRAEARDEYDLKLRRFVMLSPQSRNSSRIAPALNRGEADGASVGSIEGSAPGASPPPRPSAPARPISRPEDEHGPAPATRPPADAGSGATGENDGEPLREHPAYEPVRLIAKGRCNKVFEAFEATLRRRVAIKQLDAGANEQQTALFWREAQFLASRGHPNVLTILGSDQARGWIITELLAGSVESKMTDGPMEPNLVRSVLRQALEGLAHFHRQGRIHGEIKPANVLVDNDGYIKLNASPGFQASDEFRAPLGSQRHVAPELLNPQVFGEVGPAVDLYCLGFTMLELLVGPGIDNLFKGIVGEGRQRDLAWLRWHHSHSETLPSLRQLVPDAPEDLVVVLDRLMAKRVSQRFACTEEAIDALENVPLLRVPLDAEHDPGRRRGPGAVIKGKPPAHREYVEQQEKSKTVRYQVSNSPYVGHLKTLLKRPAVRYGLYASLFLVAALVLLGSLGPRLRRVRIETTPAGATVTLNNEAKGCQTPVDLDLAVGHHVLEFDLQGYERGKLAVDVERQGAAGPFVCALVPIARKPASAPRDEHKPCPVTIESIPTNAQILLDGQSVPGPVAGELRTPGQLELTPGTYEVDLRADGHQPLKTAIQVCKGKDNCFKFKLEKLAKQEREPAEPTRKTATTRPSGSEDHEPRDSAAARTAPEYRPVTTPAPARRRVVTRDRLVPYRWKLPDDIGPDDRLAYFKEARLILDAAWTQAGSQALQTAEEAFERARSIHESDPHLDFAYGLLLQRHCAIRAAKTRFEAAKESEWNRQQQRERCFAEGRVPDDVPFPGSWRQMTRLYLAEKQWAQATGACLDLLRYCMRSHKTIQQFAAAGKPVEYDTVTFEILHENVRFVGHSFGYIKFHCPPAARFSIQPLGRALRLVESKLDEDPYRRLLRDSFGEAGVFCADSTDPEEFAAVPAPPEDDGSDALEDLALSLELERHLMIEAIEDEIHGPGGATGRSAPVAARSSSAAPLPLRVASVGRR